ncbi:MAG: TolC family protein [Planctomycetia bacterium]|nr:TolC family protein [Planctomycetia bacterium]
MLLPTLNAGTNYHLHNGGLQRARGAIFGLAEQSVYFGGGARTLAAESVSFPAIRIFSHLGDALFEPLAARQHTVVRSLDAGATTNSILLDVSTRYLDLMAAEARLEILRQSRLDVGEVVRVTTNFAKVGQGRQADADRARTEASLIDSELQRATEQVAVAAAELARVVNLDPSVRLKTVGGPIPILQLVDTSDKLERLIEVALRRRPEVAARSAEIAENQSRYRQERMRPFFPTISVGFSAGEFGGGSNFTSPTFGHFAGRSDFDALAYWTVQNFGVGNAAIRNGRRAQTDQAAANRIRAVNLVRREVAEAYVSSVATRRQLDIFENRLASAEAGLREEFNRIRGGEGLPIELLDSLSRAVAARQALVAAIAAYDQAQFRLFVALGQLPKLALPEVQSLASPVHQ